MKTLDCRGMACPQPVINIKEALEGATSEFLVIVGSESACTSVTRFAESQGARVSSAQQGSDYHLTIAPGPSVADEAAVRDAGTARNSVVFVSSEVMGRGDDELGAILMTAFLDTLSQFKGEISHAIFVNAGAKLTIEGSPLLQQLRQLEEVGVVVLVCGTCLNHFGIKDQLAVGSVSNMYAIIETLSKAGNVIRP